MNAVIENYQTTGHGNSTVANAAINKARKATPEELRSMFRSYIRWNGTDYDFGWILHN